MLLVYTYVIKALSGKDQMVVNSNGSVSGSQNPINFVLEDFYIGHNPPSAGSALT